MSVSGIKSWHLYSAGAAGCVAVSVGLWLSVVSPTLAQQTLNEERRTELGTRRQKAADLQTTVSQRRVELAALNDNLSASGLRLEDGARINQRLSAIDELATQNRLKISDVRHGWAAEATHYRIVPISVSGTGTYASCTAFVHQLRTEFPDTGVASLETTAAPDAQTPGGVTFHFDLVWYTRK